MTSEEVLTIARTMAEKQHEQLDRYERPRATFYPEHKHWAVRFFSKWNKSPDHPDADAYIFVRVNDETGHATYSSFDPQRPTGRKRVSFGYESTNSPSIDPNLDRQYKLEAQRLLLQEANQIANVLNLDEQLPITESNVVRSFILPLVGARSWKAIGTISTRSYTYCVSKSNQFCYLMGRHQEEDLHRWKTEYVWPVSRMDNNAAYQLATQWLSAISIDVKRLERECRLHVNAAVPQERAKRFVPLYSVYWTSKERERRGSVASVQLFLPTKTLVQLHVEDPRYNLRVPIDVMSLVQTNAP